MTENRPAHNGLVGGSSPSGPTPILPNAAAALAEFEAFRIGAVSALPQRLPQRNEPLPKVSARELLALKALHEDGYDYDFCYMSFDTIARQGGLDRKHVRRSVRALARKGLAQYARGLCTEDGEMAGSGYGITDAGRVLLATIPVTPFAGSGSSGDE